MPSITLADKPSIRYTAGMLAWLLAAAVAAAAAPEAPKADPASELKLAKYFLSVPTESAEPSLVDPFLALDAETLPKALRLKVRAKQLEIRTLISIHQAKKRGLARRAENCQPKRYKVGDVGMIRLVGAEEIEEEIIDCVQRRTDCTEDEMICGFSLFVTVKPRPKARPLKRFFLLPADPLMGIVTSCRSGGSGSTNFFGGSSPRCER
jgi:hypothetical protein